MPQGCQTQSINKCVFDDCVLLCRTEEVDATLDRTDLCNSDNIESLSCLLDHTVTLCCNTVQGPKFSIEVYTKKPCSVHKL
jgi:hypothetical protein